MARLSKYIYRGRELPTARPRRIIKISQRPLNSSPFHAQIIKDISSWNHVV